MICCVVFGLAEKFEDFARASHIRTSHGAARRSIDENAGHS
jgi:hypothetical protein